MLLAMFTVFFQFQRASMNFETRTGNETLFTRGSDQLSWISAREACDNMSYAILSGMRAEHALGLLHVGEFAWIDGKEYTFCYEKNVNETKEICRYVAVRREDTRNNHTYVCNKEGQYERNEDILLSYTDAIKQCMTSSAFLQVVENFALPMIIPVNRTYWINDYNAISIIKRLSPVEKVTEICIGILKLDRDKFEFGTTSCDENHTVICDASGIHTALTLTIRNEMMPRLVDLKGSNQPQADGGVDTALTLTTRNEMMPRLGDLKGSDPPQADDTMQIFLALGSICGFMSFLLVIGAMLIFAITKYHKCRSQCQETLSRDNTTQVDAESVSYGIVF